MPSSAELLLDTSAAIALVLTTHENHDPVVRQVSGKTLGLCGHAAIETYSVLTRLPGAQRVSTQAALAIIRNNFPASHSLGVASARTSIEALQSAGISGGSVYDGLVALAAREAGIRLLSCDRRAAVTYAQLGIDVELV
ncbi:PIN domain-containing protein [Rathayibacter sp. CAU 1779]